MVSFELTCKSMYFNCQIVILDFQNLMNLWNLCILRFGFAVSSIRLGASAVMLARLDPGIVCSLITGPPVVWTLFLSRSFCTLECLFAIMRHLSHVYRHVHELPSHDFSVFSGQC